MSALPAPNVPVFERTPVGYQLRIPDVGVVLDARQVRWEHGSLYAIVSVRTKMAGIRTIDGVVTEQRVNLSGDRGRKDLATVCGDRSPGIDLDWRGFVEELAVRVLTAEREGQPFIAVGNLPPRIAQSYVIDPVVPAGMVAFFYGPGAATKGFLMTAMCVSIETGVTIIPGWLPRKGRALYLDWESDEWDLDDRVKRIARGANLPKAPDISYRQCVGPLVDQIDDVERQVRREGTTFLVVDSTGMALSTSREGGDANESTIRLFQALRRLPCAVAAVDHVVGAEITGRRSSRPYGSVYKVNLARNTYEIRALAPRAGEEGTTHITVTHRKTNTRSYLSTAGYAVLFGDDGSVAWQSEEVRQDPVEEDTAGRQWPTATRTKLREVLTRGHATVEQLAAAIEMDGETVRKVLSRYAERAAKPENRWFNKLPSGAWENLPLPGDPPGEVRNAAG